MESIAERLKHARQLRALTQAQLADAAHVALKNISILEGGDRENMQLDTVYKLAAALECSEAWLAFGFGEPPVSKQGAA